MNRRYLLTIIIIPLIVISASFFARGLWVHVKQKILGTMRMNNRNGLNIYTKILVLSFQNSTDKNVS